MILSSVSDDNGVRSLVEIMSVWHNVIWLGQSKVEPSQDYIRVSLLFCNDLRRIYGACHPPLIEAPEMRRGYGGDCQEKGRNSRPYIGLIG